MQKTLSPPPRPLYHLHHNLLSPAYHPVPKHGRRVTQAAVDFGQRASLQLIAKLPESAPRVSCVHSPIRKTAASPKANTPISLLPVVATLIKSIRSWSALVPTSSLVQSNAAANVSHVSLTILCPVLMWCRTPILASLICPRMNQASSSCSLSTSTRPNTTRLCL
jgi:hypothetical protein